MEYLNQIVHVKHVLIRDHVFRGSLMIQAQALGLLLTAVKPITVLLCMF